MSKNAHIAPAQFERNQARAEQARNCHALNDWAQLANRIAQRDPDYAHKLQEDVNRLRAVLQCAELDGGEA